MATSEGRFRDSACMQRIPNSFHYLFHTCIEIIEYHQAHSGKNACGIALSYGKNQFIIQHSIRFISTIHER